MRCSDSVTSSRVTYIDSYEAIYVTPWRELAEMKRQATLVTFEFKFESDSA
jgi:hypothetical protein